MADGREVHGVAPRFSSQNGLSNLVTSTPFTVSTSSLKVFQVIMHSSTLNTSTIKMTTGDGATTLAIIKIPPRGYIQFEAPFVADRGLQFSVDLDNGGTLVFAAFTVVGVFHSNPSA